MKVTSIFSLLATSEKQDEAFSHCCVSSPGSVCSLEQAGRIVLWGHEGRESGSWCQRGGVGWTWEARWSSEEQKLRSPGVQLSPGLGLVLKSADGVREEERAFGKTRSGEMRPDLRGLVIQHSGISLSQVVATVCNRQEMLYNLLGI